MSYSQQEDEQERKLFVGGFDKGTADEEQLKAYFEQYGDVIDCTILRQRDAEKQSRGFGFILFADALTVEKIMKLKKEGTTFSLDGHHIEVKRALPKVPRGAGNVGTSRTGGVFRKVFVGGLPSTITEYELRKYFETYGRVNEIELLRDRETNRLRGFAFIAFDEEDSADKCLQRRSHEICKKVCEVKRAQTRFNKDEDGGAGGGGRRSSGYDNRDNLRQNQSSNNSGVASTGGLGMTDINQMIQQAFLMGQQSGLPNTSAPLLNLGAVAQPAQPSNNVLLQALMNQHAPPVIAPPVPVVAPVIPAAPTNNAAALTQLAQLLQGGGIDPNALAALLKDPQGQGAPAAATGVKPTGSYSTSYPSVSSYEASKYGPIKDDERKRAYRPY